MLFSGKFKMAAMDESDKEIQNAIENTSSSDSSVGVGRMKILRSVMMKTINSFTGDLKLISPLNGVDSTHLDHLQKKTVSQLQANIQCELEQMYKEENLEILLNSLDKVIAENPSQPGTLAWRPSGNVRQDVRCEVGMLKREKLNVLKQTLNDLEGQNKLLRDRVKDREQHLLRTRDKILSIADDFAEIVDTENITD